MRLARSTRLALRKAHLWLALVLGLPLAVVAATGLPITYWYETDALFAAGYYHGSPPSARRASFDALAGAARAAVPAGDLQSVFLLPAYGTAQAALALPGGAQREVSLDLATARPLGQRALSDAAISWLYSVHTRLALDRAGLDETGRIAVMALAAAFVALVASGVILWWPKRPTWRTFAPVLRWRRVWLDLHNKAGLYALAPLALAAGTTLLLEVPAARGVGGGVAPIVPARAGPGGTRSLEALAVAAANATPGRAAMGVFDLDLPGRILVVTGDDWAGFRWVAIDRRTAAPLLVSALKPEAKVSPADPSTLIALHQGHRWGRLGQALFAMASVVPVLLYATGLVLWLRRRAIRPEGENG